MTIFFSTLLLSLKTFFSGSFGFGSESPLRFSAFLPSFPFAALALSPRAFVPGGVEENEGRAGGRVARAMRNVRKFRRGDI